MCVVQLYYVKPVNWPSLPELPLPLHLRKENLHNSPHIVDQNKKYKVSIMEQRIFNA